MLYTFLILIFITLVVDSLGWVRFLWFISIGYGASIAAIAIALAALHFHTLTLATALLLAISMAYGCRLAGYLLYREIKSSNYRSAISYDAQQSTDYSLVARISIWLSCVLLYVCQMSPITIRVVEQSRIDVSHSAPSILLIDTDLTLWAGICVACLGWIVESIADRQKSRAKRKNPKRFVSTGLYRIVRCPNYFGEVLFWTGILLSGITSFTAWWHWALALLGYVAIVYIMFSGARRLELRQDHNYGDDNEYSTYKSTTPILLPFVPIYSVKRFGWLRG